MARGLSKLLEICVPQKFAKLGWGGGGVHKLSGMEGGGGGENQSKLCSLGGRVSTLALILECEMYLISFWLFEPIALS